MLLALGNRRRTIHVAAAVSIIVIAAGATACQALPTATPSPNPTAPPTAPTAVPSATPSVTTPAATTASPTLARSLATVNLITVDQVPTIDEERFGETPEGAGRPAEAITVCIPDGASDELGASQVIGRNFRRDRRSDGSTNPPAAPFGPDPTIYTQAMQFDSAGSAATAYGTYRGWLDTCTATIKARKDVPLGAGVDWIAVQTKVPGAKAGFAERVWREGNDSSENGYFESVGLALVGDRLAVTVSLQYGQDYNVAYQPEGDQEAGLPAHPQFKLLAAAAQRLNG